MRGQVREELDNSFAVETVSSLGPEKVTRVAVAERLSHPDFAKAVAQEVRMILLPAPCTSWSFLFRFVRLYSRRGGLGF